MKTFKAYMKKEFMESIRQYRYLLIAAGILFFAIMDPIILKLLPKLLATQVNGADLSSLFTVNKIMGYQNYIKDLTQIGFLVVILALSGVLSEEINQNKLVFPYSKGASPWQLVMAKFINYSIFSFIFVIIGFMVNYYYVDILIEGDAIAFGGIIKAALLTSAYFTFSISLAMFLSSLFKKGYVAGILALVISYGLSGLSVIQSLSKLLPYNLIRAANTFGSTEIVLTIIATIVGIVIFLGLTIYRMNKVEII